MNPNDETPSLQSTDGTQSLTSFGALVLLIARQPNRELYRVRGAAEAARRGQNIELCAGGPFRQGRHPLNFFQIPVFWLMPRLTLNVALLKQFSRRTGHPQRARHRLPRRNVFENRSNGVATL